MPTPTLRPDPDAIDPDAIDLDAVDLSDRVFWGEPPEVRHAVLDRLRRERPFAFFAEPVVPFIEPGAGYHAVTRYADVAATSSRPALFSSGAGAVSIADMPPDLNEFYGSLISMDGEPTDLAAVETAVRACPTGALQLLD
ncbi:hypothetical protein [uncultured Modestobacter sp.]|uniref:hypothetical protein n=1 Tax=uncultured Modestobacter sp. TaxID=380048 RepID=UPI002616EF40|nr:hypothetical protein [uncultured Modestobacter sp.]